MVYDLWIDRLIWLLKSDILFVFFLETMKKPTTPIITNIETHRRSNCVLTRTCLGPTDDYNEYTTVIDTSIETQDWNIENQHLFSKQAKRPIPFSSQESRTRDNIIRDCSFSDCQKFISSPFGVGCRIFAFGECRWPLTFQVTLILDERFNDFETAFKFDQTQEFVDVSFKYSRERLHELVISANFSSYLCQLACGTNTGSLQLYCPTRPNKPLTERRRPNELRNRSNNTHIRFPGI